MRSAYARLQTENNKGAARPRNVEKARSPTREEMQALQQSRDDLAVATEEFEVVDREICRLLTVARKTIFPKKRYQFHLFGTNTTAYYKHRGFGEQEPHKSQWWDMACSSGLFHGSGRVLYERLRNATDEKAKAEKAKRNIQLNFNRLVRPFLRDLSITDLPNEILIYILALVRAGGVDSIKSARLVCRDFNAVSSPLLVLHVPLRFERYSLNNLNSISKHPIIGTGVRTIDIDMRFYDSSFLDMTEFATYYAEKIDNLVRQFDRSNTWQDYGIPGYAAPEMIYRGNRLSHVLRRIAAGNLYPEEINFDVMEWLDDSDEDDDGGSSNPQEEEDYIDLGNDDGLKIQRCIQEIHRQYRAHWCMRLREVDSQDFYQAVASAIQRMPCARKLAFSDRDDGDSSNEDNSILRLMKPGAKVKDGLRQLMLRPIPGHEANEENLARPRYECIVNLVAALQTAGALPNSIDINLTSLGHPGSLGPGPGMRENFNLGIRELKTLKFKYDQPLGEDEASEIQEFLAACLEAPSLETLQVVTKINKDPPAPRVDVEEMMGLVSRQNLTNVNIRQVVADE